MADYSWEKDRTETLKGKHKTESKQTSNKQCTTRITNTLRIVNCNSIANRYTKYNINATVPVLLGVDVLVLY